MLTNTSSQVYFGVCLWQKNLKKKQLDESVQPTMPCPNSII